jgi:RNA polymerase sigma factor (sigma-70 family)
MLRTDAGLVRQVLAGHSPSFDELVRRHLTMTYGIAFSYTRNHADAEDLSQEAMLKAFLSLDTLREPKKFGHWLSVITRNLAVRYGRKIRNEQEAIQQSVAQPRDRNSAVYDDMRELLEEQIAALEPIPREVLMLHYFSGKSTREIASTMNVSQAAVLKLLQRAREVLGAKLISELNIPSRSNDSIAKNRPAIMKTILASGVSWNLAGTTWKSVAASTLLSGKGMAAAVLLVGVIASYFALPSETQPPVPEPKVSVATNQPAAEIEAAQVPVSTPDRESEPSAEIPETTSEIAVTVATPVAVPEI